MYDWVYFNLQNIKCLGQHFTYLHCKFLSNLYYVTYSVIYLQNPISLQTCDRGIKLFV